MQQFHIKFDQPALRSVHHRHYGRQKQASSARQKESSSEGTPAKTVTFQQTGLDIPRSQEIPPPSEGLRTCTVAPAEGKGPNELAQSAASPPAEDVDGEPDYEIPASSSEGTGTRSSRRWRSPMQRLIKAYMATMAIASSTSSVEGEIFSLAAMFPHAQERHPMQELHPCAASADPNTMYLHKAMR